MQMPQRVFTLHQCVFLIKRDRAAIMQIRCSAARLSFTRPSSHCSRENHLLAAHSTALPLPRKTMQEERERESIYSSPPWCGSLQSRKYAIRLLPTLNNLHSHLVIYIHKSIATADGWLVGRLGDDVSQTNTHKSRSDAESVSAGAVSSKGRSLKVPSEHIKGGKYKRLQAGMTKH